MRRKGGNWGKVLALDNDDLDAVRRVCICNPEVLKSSIHFPFLFSFHALTPSEPSLFISHNWTQIVSLL